jgi:hypothetical protein
MKRLVRLLLAVAAGASTLGLAIPMASASNGAQTGSAQGTDFSFGPAPAGSIPASCPGTAANASNDLLFLSGNQVVYQGGIGINAEGTAQFTATDVDGNAFVYVGHAHVWANNTNLTLSFNGTGPVNLRLYIVDNKPHGLQLVNVTCS